MSIFGKIRSFFAPEILPIVHSELSDPKVNEFPYGFYIGHYETLDSLSYYTGFGGEITSAQLCRHSQDMSMQQRLCDLARMGYIDKRVEIVKGITPIKRNHYSMNIKGKKALIKWKDLFFDKLTKWKKRNGLKD